MKITLPSVLLLLVTVFFVGTCGVSFAAAESAEEKEINMREVHDFLKECGHYYLATVEGDQPRVRPFGTQVIFEGKLYFLTGNFKDVSKQMSINPKIEICTYDGKGTWLRVQAIAVNDDRIEAKQFVLDTHPELEGMYSADDDIIQVLYLKDAVAGYYSFSGEPRIIEF